MVPQNTGCLWRSKLFEKNSFDPWCDGDSKEVLIFPEFPDPVSVAGMEDFHLQLRLLKKINLRWGMYGRYNPFAWNVDFLNDPIRRENHLKKIVRQMKVMRFYAKELFPEREFEEVMDEFFSTSSFS